MRKGGYVPASFWRRRFLEGASADVRLLALYLVTCGAGSVAGVVRASPRAMAEETGLDPRAVVDALRALIARHFIVPYSLDDHLALVDVWAVPAILDHAPIPNGNVGKKVVKELADLIGGGADSFWFALGVALKGNGGDRFLADHVQMMIDRGLVKPDAVREVAADLGVSDILRSPDEVKRLESYSTPTSDGRPHPHDPYDDERVQIGGARKAGDPPATLEPLPPWAALVDAWNESPKTGDAGPLAWMHLPISPELLEEAESRVRQLGGVENISKLMAKVEASDFLLGRRANRDGEFYTLTFAAMCRESMFLKIMEGAYDNPPSPKTVTEPQR